MADPPHSHRLGGFPAARPAAGLHRLSEHPSPWYFSASDDDGPGGDGADGGGRFDLRPPRGTCYTAESLAGCLVEKLLRTPVRVVVVERLDELFHATATVTGEVRTADLTSRRAAGFGVNAEIHASIDYTAPRRWARALDGAGFRALRHRLRGDATGRLAGRALFGQAGPRRRAPSGLRTAVVRPLDTDTATRLLEERGVRVLPIPDDVPLS